MQRCDSRLPKRWSMRVQRSQTISFSRTNRREGSCKGRLRSRESWLLQGVQLLGFPRLISSHRWKHESSSREAYFEGYSRNCFFSFIFLQAVVSKPVIGWEFVDFDVIHDIVSVRLPLGVDPHIEFGRPVELCGHLMLNVVVSGLHERCVESLWVDSLVVLVMMIIVPVTACASHSLVGQFLRSWYDN